MWFPEATPKKASWWGNNKLTLKKHLVHFFSPCEFTLNGNSKK